MKINSLPVWSHRFSYREEWTDKLTWACHSQINSFSGVVHSKRKILIYNMLFWDAPRGRNIAKNTEGLAFGFEV
jgi:hypothetical protein